MRELRQNASKLLERVKAGEIIRITDRGRPIARLTPEPENSWDELIASGQIRLPLSNEPLSALPPPPPLKPGEKTASEILEEMRRDER